MSECHVRPGVLRAHGESEKEGESAGAGPGCRVLLTLLGAPGPPWQSECRPGSLLEQEATEQRREMLVQVPGKEKREP